MTGFIKISEAVSIALHTCVGLESGDTDFHSAKRIAETFGFSAHHTTKVVKQLVNAGILETERGPCGGTRLAKSPKKIKLLDIYTAVDGTPKQTACLLNPKICSGNSCKLGKFIADEKIRIMKLFNNTSLADILITKKTI